MEGMDYMEHPGTAYIRVKGSDGKPRDARFQDLTPEEMRDVFDTVPKERVILWAEYLADQLRWHEWFLHSQGYVRVDLDGEDEQ